MTNEHMERCSISLDITTTDLLEYLKLQRLTKVNTGKDRGQSEPSYSAGGDGR